MLIHLTAVAVLALCLASLTGWGGLTHRLCGGGARVPWTYRAALGLPTLLLLGGPLNLLRLARPAGLDALVAAGLALLAWQAAAWLRARRAGDAGPAPDPWARAADLLPRVVIGATALFLVATLMPAGVFNHHDDMQKYMVPPLRMVQTGTLGGNPFETTGFYSLGYQSFFQGFIVAHFPLTYLNGFDVVLCFLLTGLLLDDLGRRGGVAPVFRTLAALVLVAINPQYVNISPVFSGSLAVAGLAWSGVLLGERIGTAPPMTVAGAAVSVGLFGAFLMGLKLTYVPFAGLCLLLLLVLLPVLARDGVWRKVGSAAAAALVAGVLMVAPWTALYAHSPVGPLLAQAGIVASHTTRATRPAPAPAPRVPEEVLRSYGVSGGAADERSIGDIFSTEPVYFGQTSLAYALVALAVAAACVPAALWLLRHRREGDPGLGAQMAVTLAAGVALVTYFAASPYIFQVVQAIRYLAPLVIPTAALAALGAARLVPVPRASPGAASGTTFGTTGGLVLAACMGLVVGLFARATVDRVAEAATSRTLVSFNLGPFNSSYHQYAFGDKMRLVVHEAQARLPAGEPVLAWIGAPFRLDYRRNPIYAIPDPDFTRRWLGMPIGDDPAALAGFLRARGIRYVIWAYDGPGMRSDASLRADIAGGHYRQRGILTLKFKEMLTALAKGGHVVFDNGRIVAFGLDPADTPSDAPADTPAEPDPDPAP